MNLIDLLVRDHENVLGFFEQFESLDKRDVDGRRELVGRIYEEMEDHAGVEEQIFHPAVAARTRPDEDAGEAVKEALEEHRLIRQLLDEVSAVQPSDPEYDAKLKVAKDMVRQHVEELEGQILPRARRLMGSDELDAMGTKVEAERTELRTEAIATAPPETDVLPPDEGPPSDWMTSEDVMAVASEPPGVVHPDDPVDAEPVRPRPNAGREGRRSQAGKKRSR